MKKALLSCSLDLRPFEKKNDDPEFPHSTTEMTILEDGSFTFSEVNKEVISEIDKGFKIYELLDDEPDTIEGYYDMVFEKIKNQIASGKARGKVEIFDQAWIFQCSQRLGFTFLGNVKNSDIKAALGDLELGEVGTPKPEEKKNHIEPQKERSEASEQTLTESVIEGVEMDLNAGSMKLLEAQPTIDAKEACGLVMKGSESKEAKMDDKNPNQYSLF